MTTVTSEVDRDAIRSCLFANYRSGNKAWLRGTSGLSHSCDVVDVDVESGNHLRFNSLGNRGAAHSIIVLRVKYSITECHSVVLSGCAARLALIARS